MNSVRLLPLLAAAAVCLFALKAAGLLLGGGYMLSGSAPASAQSTQKAGEAKKPAEEPKPKAQEQKTTPKAEKKAAEKPATPAETKPAGKAEQEKMAEKQGGEKDAVKAKKAAKPKEMKRADYQGKATDAPTGSELAILQSLSKRRKELDKRARALQLREKLIKVAEGRVEARIAELKIIEAKIEKEFKERDSRREAEYTKLVALYSRMKPKKAAKIFNRLDIEVLTELVRKMKATKTSPILAAMDPAVAERVTMEIAVQNRNVNGGAESLPKISGESPR